jgi:homoserine O-acetyltransferase
VLFRSLWVCHALTANADVADWWSGIFGEGRLLDPAKYHIICPNILGSCYGSSSAISTNPHTGLPYGNAFPLITIRDMALAMDALRSHLGIEQIDLLVGGSLGGQQAQELVLRQPGLVKQLILLATNAQHSAWGQAWNEAQRMALELGDGGLAAARAIAMLSYRGYEMFVKDQTDPEPTTLLRHKVTKYQRYQGQKLAKRFDPDSYRILSQAMDSHHIGRNRGAVPQTLAKIDARTLVVSISSDGLFPPVEQAFLARHIPGAKLATIDSPFGHDGFLTETEALNKIGLQWLAENAEA